MVKRYSNSSVFLAAFICIILFYSGLVKVSDKTRLISFIEPGKINLIHGSLISSPVKTSDGSYYSARFKINSFKAQNGIKGQAGGSLVVYIPVDQAEALLPGKLYSKARLHGNEKAPLWEAGGVYTLSGRFGRDSTKFYISECKDSFFPQTLYGRLDYLRALCRLQFKRLMYSWGAAGGLLLALLCGAKEYTSSDISLSFKNAGLSHILALSGMHLSMFSGIAIFAGKKIGRKKLTFIIRIIALVLFVWFAGFSPSLLRAFLCNMLLIIAALANVKKPDMLLVLAFSFLCQTIIAPQDIFNSGFILSYAALAGILLTNSFFNKIYSRFLPSYFAASLGSSTGAQIFTAPVSLKLFGSFAPVGIIATSIVSPVVTLFIYSGLVLIILSLVCPVIAGASGFFINLEYTVIKYLVAFFSKAFIWRIN
ncbi:MAG: ComEC/Rec2 family competence protein [Treponema sp.]|nr:ComEC/Rec2 family competence protein [Treponema sp.]